MKYVAIFDGPRAPRRRLPDGCCAAGRRRGRTRGSRQRQRAEREQLQQQQHQHREQQRHEQRQRRRRPSSAPMPMIVSLSLAAVCLVCSVGGPVDAAPASYGGVAARSVAPGSSPTAAHQRPKDAVAGEEEVQDDVPVFEQTSPNVNAFEGQTIYLPCRVHGLGDKVVSWMRSRDLHIITSGGIGFSSDERFKLQHLEGSDAWTLQLDRVRRQDAGRYECQVNTEPKMMYAVQLNVRDPSMPDGYDEPHSQQTRISYESTAPVAAIMGPREQRVPAGTTITLKCVITSPYQTRPIKGVQWFRDNKLLTFQAARGGINVETVASTAQTLSEATLANVTARDTGQYSCRPAEGKADTVALYVEDGAEHASEAMQRDAGFATSSGRRTSCLGGRSLTWLTVVLANCVLLHQDRVARHVPVFG